MKLKKIIKHSFSIPLILFFTFIINWNVIIYWAQIKVDIKMNTEQMIKVWDVKRSIKQKEKQLKREHKEIVNDYLNAIKKEDKNLQSLYLKEMSLSREKIEDVRLKKEKINKLIQKHVLQKQLQ